MNIIPSFIRNRLDFILTDINHFGTSLRNLTIRDVRDAGVSISTAVKTTLWNRKAAYVSAYSLTSAGVATQLPLIGTYLGPVGITIATSLKWAAAFKYSTTAVVALSGLYGALMVALLIGLCILAYLAIKGYYWIEINTWFSPIGWCMDLINKPFHYFDIQYNEKPWVPFG